MTVSEHLIAKRVSWLDAKRVREKAQRELDRAQQALNDARAIEWEAQTQFNESAQAFDMAFEQETR